MKERRLETLLRDGGIRVSDDDCSHGGHNSDPADNFSPTPVRVIRCQVHHCPGFRMRRGHDQVPVWALPVQRLLSDLLADTQLGDHVAVAIGIMCLQVVQQTAAFAYQH